MQKLSLRATRFVTQLFDESKANNNVSRYKATDQPSLIVMHRLSTIQAKRGLGTLLEMITASDPRKERYVYRMTFLVFDLRVSTGKKTNIDIYPISFVDYVNTVSDSGISVKDDQFIKCFRAKQNSIATNADSWLSELEDIDYEELP